MFTNVYYIIYKCAQRFVFNLGTCKHVIQLVNLTCINTYFLQQSNLTDLCTQFCLPFLALYGPTNERRV